MYQGHLTGSRPPVGIYPVVAQVERHPEGVYDTKRFVVKFGAIDIDFEDLPLAKNLWTALGCLGITSWVERSRSKGYHVWIFTDDWVPAVLVRSTLQVACDVVGYSPKEIFPKQTELTDGSPGNYIRLPYPGALSSGVPGTGRRAMLDVAGSPADVIQLEDWVSLAWDSRCSRSELEQAASLARKPAPKHRPAVLGARTPSGGSLEPLVRKMGGLSYTIWANGPLEGSDRSGTMFKFCHCLKNDGFTPDEAIVLVLDLDDKLGKFVDRADREQRINEIIERVYDL